MTNKDMLTDEFICLAIATSCLENRVCPIIDRCPNRVTNPAYEPDRTDDEVTEACVKELKAWLYEQVDMCEGCDRHGICKPTQPHYTCMWRKKNG